MSLKGDTKGYIDFGMGNTDANLGGGTLKACCEYRITMLKAVWTSENPLGIGSIAIQIDTSCTMTSVDSRSMTFPIAKSGQLSFGAALIDGAKLLPTSGSRKNQFRLLYEGNGETGKVAGSLKCEFMMQTRLAK